MGLDEGDETGMASLMRAALAGDESAYARFLGIAAVRVRAVARRKLGSNGSVAPEDIVQETLLAVHLKRHTWRKGEPILPWLMAIARYKMIDAFRRNGTLRTVDIDDLAEILPAPETQNEHTQRREIETALADLSEGQRRVVRAIGVEGKSIHETAGALDMNETAVRVAFHRGLSAIAAKLGRRT
ncbi:MAG: sigma-70 family RNA polymerase sigma factor [Devosia sp.]